MSIFRNSLYLLSLIICGVCIWLPIKGSDGFFTTFRQIYSPQFHREILLWQLTGPILMGTASLLLYLIKRKNRKWLTAGIVLSFATAWITSAFSHRVSHDFGHVVFDECSGIYSTVISALSVTAACAMLIATCIDFRCFRKHENESGIPT
jgi:phosphatidylglycerophosphatase A